MDGGRELYCRFRVHHVIFGGNNDQELRVHLCRSLLEVHTELSGNIERYNRLPLANPVAHDSAVSLGAIPYFCVKLVNLIGLGVRHAMGWRGEIHRADFLYEPETSIPWPGAMVMTPVWHELYGVGF